MSVCWKNCTERSENPGGLSCGCFWPLSEEEVIVIGDLWGAMQPQCVCRSVRAAAAGPQSTHRHGFSVNVTVTLGL